MAFLFVIDISSKYELDPLFLKEVGQTAITFSELIRKDHPSSYGKVLPLIERDSIGLLHSNPQWTILHECNDDLLIQPLSLCAKQLISPLSLPSTPLPPSLASPLPRSFPSKPLPADIIQSALHNSPLPPHRSLFILWLCDEEQFQQRAIHEYEQQREPSSSHHFHYFVLPSHLSQQRRYLHSLFPQLQLYKERYFPVTLISLILSPNVTLSIRLQPDVSVEKLALSGKNQILTDIKKIIVRGSVSHSYLLSPPILTRRMLAAVSPQVVSGNFYNSVLSSVSRRNMDPLTLMPCEEENGEREERGAISANKYASNDEEILLSLIAALKIKHQKLLCKVEDSQGRVFVGALSSITNGAHSSLALSVIDNTW